MATFPDRRSMVSGVSPPRRTRGNQRHPCKDGGLPRGELEARIHAAAAMGHADSADSAAAASGVCKLFVPGRFCLTGEHSDWAAGYRTHDPSIPRGTALVIGLQEGLYATCTRQSSALTLHSHLGGTLDLSLEDLLSTATKRKSVWRFAAATAHVVLTRFSHAHGLKLNVTSSTLPAARGLSSSAAICVLTARAYNVLYGLGLSTAGEMDVAYAGERLTGSACGRMDHIVAIGPGRTVRMTFDGDYVSYEVLAASRKAVTVVVADLAAGKDTAAILAGLHAAYRHADSAPARRLRCYLGERNVYFVGAMLKAIEEGNSQRLGQLMTDSQKEFDEAATPFCVDELTAPKLHAILEDSDVQPLVYGGKGVGSQGDGSVQFVARDAAAGTQLAVLLNEKLGTDALVLTIGGDSPTPKPRETNGAPTPVYGSSKETYATALQPQQQRAHEEASDADDDCDVKTCVIPVAGHGSRLFPASRAVQPKALLPIVDADGFAKPVLLHLVEGAVRAGMSRVVIVVAPGEQEARVRELFSRPPDALWKALKPYMRDYAERIARLAAVVDVRLQTAPKGFGDGVACAQVPAGQPFALLLGDVVFRGVGGGGSGGERGRADDGGVVASLCEVVAAFRSCGGAMSVVGVTRVTKASASAYGVVSTESGLTRGGCAKRVVELVEKPSGEQLERLSRDGCCDVVLGPYVLSRDLMPALADDIAQARTDCGEVQLTPALARVMRDHGMLAVLVSAEALDTGNAREYAHTLVRMAA